MNTDKIFIGMKSSVISTGHRVDGKPYISSGELEPSIFYLKGKYIYDLLSKEKLHSSPLGLKTGEKFVDVKNYGFIPFCIFMNEFIQHEESIDLKRYMSKRKILKLVNENDYKSSFTKR